MSGVVWDVLRDLGFPPSTTRVCEEFGVGKGDWEGAPLASAASSECSGIEELLIGGKEDEKKVGGRKEGRI